MLDHKMVRTYEYLSVPYKDPEKQRKFRMHWARTKKRFLRSVLWSAKRRPCIDCNLAYPPYVMDFDHVKGKKSGGVSAMTGSASKKRILKEIAKCEVVCANCHRKRTYARKQWGQRKT